MSVDYDWDPKRQVISVRDPRLTRLLLREPERCATLSEYAQACGLEVAEVVEMLGIYLDAGMLALDFFGDEVFVNTGPLGRPLPEGCVDVPPNLWEQLRERAGIEMAYALWRMLRSLERAGWTVEHRIPRIMSGLGRVTDPPYLGVRVGGGLVPVMLFPDAEMLGRNGGLLDQYEWAGARALAVACDERALDEMVTATRRWMLTRAVPAGMAVLILESPRYNPTMLSPGDAAVSPVNLTRDSLGNYFF